ncbi:MAG: TonB-dependent receptor [Chitinophagaceae bacterium]|nr:TonB-dependent receptor [Chitinophagaceae bacterium]
MRLRKFLVSLSFSLPFVSIAQNDSNTVHRLNEVTVTAFKTVRGIGHMPELKDGIIYAGKKSELIIVDSLDANKAINNTRQILGRIPGLNIVETETGGFTANGIATRGLNPIQSIEMNTRQNGYNISADIFGYNEAYYIPPMEAVQRIEMVRGAASLQFGSQFGGLVNYVIRDAPVNKSFEWNTSQTVGSFGLFNSFNSIGGSFKKFNYYAFMQYRYMDGYRPNSRQWQFSGFGKLQYAVSSKLNFGIEYSILRNQLKMPGGLTDSLFNLDAKISTRSRNWLRSPWNIIAANASYSIDEETSLNIKSTYLFSSRSLVWRNEDGGPSALDLIDPVTNEYTPREVGVERMHNSTTEIRLSRNYFLGNQKSTLATGVRLAYAWFDRMGAGEGTTGADFNLSINGNWGYDLKFTTKNTTTFIENIFRVSEKFSVTPGFRLEYLESTSKGYKISDNNKLESNEKRVRSFPLFGLGLQYKASMNANVYANISQAYKPIEYGQLEPFGISSKIDPGLKDANGFNSDLGFRGTIKNFLNFDIGVFYMAYNNRIGVLLKTDPVTGDLYSLRTNIANSVHKGIETYVEFNLLKYLNNHSHYGLSIFNSFAYIDARYTSGEFSGKRVEAAANTINRVGLIFNSKKLSATFQVNSVGDAYGDASNVKQSEDPIAGYIPAYTVLDLSGTYKIKNYSVKIGVNNLADKSYYTRRTDEYPGPGIIPSIGRSVYLGIAARF